MTYKDPSASEQERSRVDRSQDGQLAQQFSSFFLVGIIGTIAHYAIMAVLIEIFGVHPLPATTAGFLGSAVLSYQLNYQFTFSSSMQHSAAFPRFLLVGSIGLMLNALIVGTLTGPVGIHWLISQMAATLTVFCWNFLANRFWTFAHDFKN